MPELLGVTECEYGIGKLYSGAMSDTEEKRRELFESAMISFAKSIRKTNPEIIEEIDRRNRSRGKK